MVYIVNDNKYKDDLPINTVNKIRNLLLSYNLIPIESNMRNSASGYYSLSVNIKGTNLITNGKGTTKEFALASCYGELMERLQNQSYFRLSIDLSPDALNYKGFFYAPDEINTSIEAFLNDNNEWLKIQLKSINTIISTKQLLEMWKSISYETTPNDFVTIPYLNLMTGNISDIPIKMISKMYMSNGMCAGNSCEEALVQGMSEVYERYVNRRIIIEKICPPVIPKAFLRNYPRIEEMITEIERWGNFKVILKDCSLGKKYPVVCAIFINRDDLTYFVKFGSHPQIEIALERTLTELLQGQDIKKMIGTKEFSYRPPIFDEEKNLMGILVNGSGYYPSEFFSKKYSYSFSNISMPSNISNKEMFMYLLDLFRKENLNVFIRDLSYLGFPSYHVIVPGFSEIERIDDLKSIDEYSGFIRIKKLIRQISYLSNDDIKELLELMDRYNIYGNSSILELLNINIEDEIPWYYTSIDLFRCAANYKIGNFKKAYILLNKYLENFYINKEMSIYFKCVRDYIGTRCENLSVSESINSLSLFYSKAMIDDVINKFIKENDIFKIFGVLNCWQCKTCPKYQNCSYKNIKEVYEKLKDIYCMNVINQKNILTKT